MEDLLMKFQQSVIDEISRTKNLVSDELKVVNENIDSLKIENAQTEQGMVWYLIIHLYLMWWLVVFYFWCKCYYIPQRNSFWQFYFIGCRVISSLLHMYVPLFYICMSMYMCFMYCSITWFLPLFTFLTHLLSLCISIFSKY